MMENTGSLLFDNKNSKYYIFSQGTVSGPLTAADVSAKVELHECSLLDYIWCESFVDWSQICLVKDFEMLVPNKPSKSVLDELKKSLAKKAEKSKLIKKPATPPPFESAAYYLYFNKSQYGPFSLNEIKNVFENKKVDANAFAWMQGWPNWKSVKDVEEICQFIPKTKTSEQTSKSKKDLRNSPRKPLVARLFVTNNEDVIVAVCRDISIGGMQVLTDKIPGQLGDNIKLNVSPADTKNVKSFVAEGEIVRILEDGRGFSFRFTKISSDTKKAIQSYLDN